MPEVVEWKFPRGGWLQVYQLPERAGGGSITLAVSDIDEIIARAQKLGIDTTHKTSSPKVKTLMITDPDGNQIASCSDARQQWHGSGATGILTTCPPVGTGCLCVEVCFVTCKRSNRPSKAPTPACRHLLSVHSRSKARLLQACSLGGCRGSMPACGHPLADHQHQPRQAVATESHLMRQTPRPMTKLSVQPKWNSYPANPAMWDESSQPRRPLCWC